MDATANDAFFLDLDGTLIETTSTPEQAQADSRVRGVLQRLTAATRGATMIVSGRSLASVDAILGLRICAAGQHGAEIRLLNPCLDDIRVELDGYAELVGHCRQICRLFPGTRLEAKNPTIALHLRRDDPRFTYLFDAVESLVEKSDGRVSCIVAHNVVELRPAAVRKGLVVEGARLFKPFSGRRPVFFGNDLPDIDGFNTARALGGFGVAVGPVLSGARYRLNSPFDVLSALEKITGAQ